MTEKNKKIGILIWLFTIFVGGLVSQRPSYIAMADGAIVVSFTIVNDDQIIEPTYLSSPSPITAPEILQRDNVRLDGWYTNTALDEPFNFSAVVNQNIHLYARWDYLSDALGKAVLTKSSESDRYRSGTVQLSLNLYEPLLNDVTFQWQMKLTETGDWRDISGANDNSYRPLRNGHYGYRLVYRTPIYDNQDNITGRTRHETSAIWITIYGEFPWLLVVVPGSLILIFMIVLFLSYKHPVHLYIDGQFYQQLRYRAQEDISDISAPQKDGYRFDGWYTDEQCLVKADLKRMPYHLIRCYGRYLKND